MPDASFIEIIQTGGVIALLGLILVGGAKGWWVYGGVYREIKKERDEWKDMALRGTELADKTAGTMENSVEAIRIAVMAIEAAKLKDRYDAEADNIRRKGDQE